jgi:Outer membrane lipoprotein
MKNNVIFLIILLTLFPLGLKQVSGEEEYLQAKNSVKSGDQEFAFMHFISLLKNNPESEHRQEALFATAEYFFRVGDYVDAFSASKEFLEEYPYSKMRIFTLLYLFKISQIWNKDQLAKDIEKQIIDSRRIILLFKDVQEDKYTSPLGINYTLRYYIDRLEFYSDGKLQTQIYY